MSLVPSLPSPPGDGFDGEGADLRAALSPGLVARPSHGEGNRRGTRTHLRASRGRGRGHPDTAAVSITLEPHDPTDDSASPIKARAQTWSAGELLVAEASLLYRSDAELATAYAHGPNEGDGVNRRVVRLCRRLLDACPEVDRADISGVGADWEAIHYDDMVFGSKTIRAGVLRVGPSVRRNIAYQAAVSRMSTAVSWSARIRLQAELAREVEELLTSCPAESACTTTRDVLGPGRIAWRLQNVGSARYRDAPWRSWAPETTLSARRMRFLELAIRSRRLSLPWPRSRCSG